MKIIIALIAGILIGAILFRKKPLGNLRVDQSDPTCEPYLFLELGTDVRTIMRKRYVTFKVRVEDFLPHE